MPATSMKRPHKLTVMLSVSEQKALVILAERQGLTVSDYVRQAIRAAVTHARN